MHFINCQYGRVHFIESSLKLNSLNNKGPEYFTASLHFMSLGHTYISWPDGFFFSLSLIKWVGERKDLFSGGSTQATHYASLRILSAFCCNLINKSLFLANLMRNIITTLFHSRNWNEEVGHRYIIRSVQKETLPLKFTQSLLSILGEYLKPGQRACPHQACFVQ